MKKGSKGKKEAQKDVPRERRERQTFKLLPSETVLPDDYPIYMDFVYIVDGKFTRQSRYFNVITVADWKRLDGEIKEIRRCDLFGHPGAYLGDRVE
jgi:hypothetical protein